MSEQLKPCPFCGRKDIFLTDEFPGLLGRGFRYARCKGCGITFVDMDRNHSVKDMISIWNTRNYKEEMTLRSELLRMKNELCLYCGQFKNAHKGACDDCRWKEAR